MSERNKGFMKIPNKLWERLFEMNIPYQGLRIFMYIYRQTVGYPINPREVSTYDISKALKIDSAHVRRSIRYLVKNQMVVRNGIFKEIQKDFTFWGIGRECPIKKIGPERLPDRAETNDSIGQSRPLLKETLKEREKKGFFSKQEEEEKQKIRMEGIRSLKRSIK